MDLQRRQMGRIERMGLGFRAGKPEEVHLVYRRVRRVVAYRGFGIPRAEREEIEQEAMKQLWQAVAGRDFAIDDGFGRFVDALAARRCIDWYRRASSFSAPLDGRMEDGEPGPLAQILSRERIELVNEAVATLDESCRRLLDLRVGAGLSFAEISRQLGRSPGALRIQFYRCVRRVGDRVGRLRPKASGAEGRESR